MFFAEQEKWSSLCRDAVSELLSRYGEYGLNEGTFGLVALRETEARRAPAGFAFNGTWKCYPCSLVKAFHLVHVLRALECGEVDRPDDLDQAIRDMITWSSNTATNYIIDLLTHTTGDTALDPEVFVSWREKRENLNRFFEKLGWPEWAGCNITLKLMGDIRYGREAQLAGSDGSNLNVLTPLAGARLFHELFSGDLPLSAQAREMAQQILFRDRTRVDAALPSYQVSEFLGAHLPPEARIWSKAGYTSWTGDPRTSYYRHDLVRIAMPSSKPVILSVMSQGEAISEHGPRIFPEIGDFLFNRLVASFS
ncbi:beta-lactamase family protein [Breoghania corrubedonensis]|uniref:beta-lactamase n=2 Tax=Breoghania corrubedonensis TaxID=665038 RepID=A0A2T5VGM1_9HYPH|nr:beta-lactamase family protein [Breoghania corrubedonensis]